MNAEDLKIKLSYEDIIKNDYFIGRPSDNRYCLVCENNEWSFFYYERGTRLRVQRFTSESDACEAFYKCLMEFKARKLEK